VLFYGQYFISPVRECIYVEGAVYISQLNIFAFQLFLKSFHHVEEGENEFLLELSLELKFKVIVLKVKGLFFSLLQ
jgi:hypothetical protein